MWLFFKYLAYFLALPFFIHFPFVLDNLSFYCWLERDLQIRNLYLSYVCYYHYHFISFLFTWCVRSFFFLIEISSMQ